MFIFEDHIELYRLLDEFDAEYATPGEIAVHEKNLESWWNLTNFQSDDVTNAILEAIYG